MRRTYGVVVPGMNLADLPGKLIVVEGPDGSGRTTQVNLLIGWLEQQGYPCVETGLTRSNLVAKELAEAKMRKVISPRTLSLFYASDFADRLENEIMPALHAGFIVVADRYIFTLMARDLVRGADAGWLRSLYSIALVPDIVFYLRVSVNDLVLRSFQNSDKLKYWESGMDMGISRDWYESFVFYQQRLAQQFNQMSREYDFHIIDGNRRVEEVSKEIQSRVGLLLNLEHKDDLECVGAGDAEY
jgi:dTMP kinase